ncbi:MAG: hypothetical protein J6N52_11710 [Clostridia bacterium]|nr:hypothetical protein [Clostridia bacterium]
MKKIFIIFSVIISMLAQYAVFAAEQITTLTYIDFEDFTSADTSGYTTYKPAVAYNVNGGSIRGDVVVFSTDDCIVDSANNDLSTVKTFTTISTDPTVMISIQADTENDICANVPLSINSANIDNPEFEIYINDVFYKTTTDLSHALRLESGKNEIYVVETSSGIKSNVLTFNCAAYDVKRVLLDTDFTDGCPSDVTANDKSGAVTNTVVDEKYGKSMLLSWDGTGEAPYMIFPSALNYGGVFVWEADYFALKNQAQRLFSAKTDENTWFNAVAVNASGAVQCVNEKNQPGDTDVTLPDGGWVNLKVVIDTNNWTYTAYVNGRKSSDNTPICVSGSRIQYVHFGLAGSGKAVIDNAKQYIVNGRFSQTVECFDSDGYMCYQTEFPYSAGGVVNITFNQKMNAESIKTITMTDADGAEIKINTEYDDNANCAVITVAQELNADAEYIINLSDVLSGAESTAESGKIIIKTDKAPYCIRSASIDLNGASSGQKIKCRVSIRNANSDSRPARIFVAVYDGNMLKSINTAETEIGKTAYEIEITVPESPPDCNAEVYLVYDNLSLIDVVR